MTTPFKQVATYTNLPGAINPRAVVRIFELYDEYSKSIDAKTSESTAKLPDLRKELNMAVKAFIGEELGFEICNCTYRPDGSIFTMFRIIKRVYDTSPQLTDINSTLNFSINPKPEGDTQ